jgi:hypothetical protein
MNLESIPQDFPNNSYSSALSGAQPKLAMVEVEGKFYTEGNTPEQQLERYLMCEDFAHQSLAYCLRKIEAGTVADPKAAMLRLYSGLQSKNWCTQQQKVWIVNQVAALGNWPNPQL